MLTEQPPYPEMTTRRFAFGLAEGTQTPGGFMLSRLYATDPALYLKKEFAPGQLLGGDKP
jgi:hypothetical protein